VIAAFAVCGTCFFAGIGCDDACKALAAQICDCEPNRASQLSCENAIKASTNREVTVEEAEICEQKLDTCTCAKLEDQDLKACGLAK
jgi:hypothetical protein